MREDKNPTLRWSVFSSSRGCEGGQGVPDNWGGVDADLQISDMACNQGLIGDLAAAQHAIHVVANQVHHPVAHTHVELNVRVACVESR